MEELIVSLFDKYPVASTVLAGLMAAHTLAVFIPSLTNTPKDDNWVRRVYRVIEWIAGVTNKTKQP